MKIYDYLNEETKKELNKNIKSKLNTEDIEAWQEAIADEYYADMYDECTAYINSNPQYKEYEVGEDRIRDLAEEFAKHDIDEFIEYCVNMDYDPYKVWIDEWFINTNRCNTFEADTIESMITDGYLVKK